MVNDYAIVSPLPDGYKHTIKDIQGLNGCLDGINVRLDNITLNGGGGGGEGSSVDLSLYATKSWVGDNFSEYCHTHDCYACKDWVESEFSCKCHSHTEYSLEGHNHDCYVTEDELYKSLANYSTCSHLHDCRYALIEHSHDCYVTEDELYKCLANYAPNCHSHECYACKVWVENCFACKSHSHENYACKDWVIDCYSTCEHDHNGIYAPIEHTHDNYAIKDHNHDKQYAPLCHTHCYLTYCDLADYASMCWVKNGFACKCHDHDDVYIKRGEITTDGCINLAGYATKEWVENNYSPIDHLHDCYVTKNCLYNCLANYALTNWVENCLTNYACKSHNHDNDYIKKGEIEISNCINLENYACKQWVHNQGYACKQWVIDEYSTCSHNHDDRYIRSTGNSDYDDISIYATKTWVTSQNYATESWVTSCYLTKNDASNTYELKGTYLTKTEADTSYQPKGDYATESWVEAKNYLTNESLKDYATTKWVEDNFSENTHEHDDRYIRSTGDPAYDNLSIYATKSDLGTTSSDLQTWVAKDYLTINDASNTYATKNDLSTTCSCLRNWVEGKNYLTEASLDSYATTEWVENNYATTEWVTNQGYAGCAWVTRNFSENTHNHDEKYINSDVFYKCLANYATKTDIEGFLTESDVEGFLTEDKANGLYAKVGTYLTKDEADNLYPALDDYKFHENQFCNLGLRFAPLNTIYEDLPETIPTYISIVNKVNYLVCSVRKLNCYLSSLNNGDNPYTDKNCNFFYAFGCDYKCNGWPLLYNEIGEFANWSTNQHSVPKPIVKEMSIHENTVISE